MNPSKCKICGVSEWNHVCGEPVPAKSKHVSGRSFKSSNKATSEIATLRDRLDILEARLGELVAQVEALSGPSEKRRKYMRNYMKERRNK